MIEVFKCKSSTERGYLILLWGRIKKSSVLKGTDVNQLSEDGNRTNEDIGMWMMDYEAA